MSTVPTSDSRAAARRPRSVILVTLAEIGGTQEYVSSLLPALLEELDVTVAAYGPGPLIAACERSGARYVPLRHVRRPIRPWRDLLGVLEVVRLLRAERPEIVHANNSKAGVVGRIAAWICGVPIRIYTAHGWAFMASSGISSRLYRLIERAMRPLTTATICVSEEGRRAGVQTRVCRPDRTLVIPNAIDVTTAPAWRGVHGTPVVVSVGRFKRPKDFPTLLRALALLVPGSQQTLIVGDGPDRPLLESLIRELGLGKSVRLAGERSDVAELLAESDLFVLSSTSEGMPMSVLEAMAAGLPVVATAVGGIPEQVVDGETGLLTAPGDASALAAALQRLLLDPGLRRDFGRAGRERAERLFDLPAFRRAHLELYRSLLNERGPVAPAP